MLLGRDHDGGLARRHLAAGSSIVLVGEAGVGKTALASCVLEGHLVVAAQCFQLLSWSAGLPLQRAVGRPIPAGDPTWTAHWLADRLPPGAVLRLEDAQWADPLTREVIGLLAGVRVVATVRSGEPESAAAIDALVGAGAVRVDLEPLGDAAAAALATRCHPRLTEVQAAALARRCGGNPLLIEEVGDDATVDHALRRSVTRRWQRLGAAARVAFGQVVLAGEPVPLDWLEGVDELLAAGLVAVHDGAVLPRHPLLAEAARTELEADSAQTRRLASALADRAYAAGRLPLAARTFALAGDRERAVACALSAVERTDRHGDRAALLRLAAECAPEAQVPALTVRAVEELVVAGEFVRAATLVGQLPERVDARWLVLVGRVRWETGDDVEALAAYEGALADRGASVQDRLIAQCEHARAVLLGAGDKDRGYALACTAYEAAVAAGVEVARALAVLGTAEHFIGGDGCLPHLTEAVELARAIGDVHVELTSANNLVASHETVGNGVQAYTLADAYAERAAELRLGGWQHQMTAMALNARMHQGEYERVLDEIPDLLTRVAQRRTRDQLEITLALALVDVGRGVEVLERVDAALTRSIADHYGRGNLNWVRSEALLWNGELAETVRAADAAVAEMASGLELFPLLTAAHARARLGVSPGTQGWPEPYTPLLEASPVERDALVAQVAGDLAAASALFTRAADLWAPHHRRGELRCRWLAADCAVDDPAAREALLVLEADLASRGWAPLLGRVRQSLRRRGVRRAAPRGRSGELTAREREIIDLVGQGLSTNEIAARLSLSRATVAAQVASARARLGAATRWQAASGG